MHASQTELRAAFLPSLCSSAPGGLGQACLHLECNKSLGVSQWWEHKRKGKEGADRRAGVSLWECPPALAVITGERLEDNLCEASLRGPQGSREASGSMDQRRHSPQVSTLFETLWLPKGDGHSHGLHLGLHRLLWRQHYNLITFSLSHGLWPLHSTPQMST